MSNPHPACIAVGNLAGAHEELRRKCADLELKRTLADQRAERAEEQLRIIGDMAVGDWDKEVVKKVDSALEDCPFDRRKYAERVRSLLDRAQRTDAAEAEVKRLREALQPIADMAKNCAGDIGWKGRPNAKVEWVRVKHVLAAIEVLEGKP